MKCNFQKAVVDRIGENEFAVRFEPITRVVPRSDEEGLDAIAACPEAVFELFVDRCDKGLPN